MCKPFKTHVIEPNFKQSKPKKKKRSEVIIKNFKSSGSKGKFFDNDFEMISLEEMEKDFIALKARSEEIKVENELMNIMRNTTKDTSLNDEYKEWKERRMSCNPYYKNYNTEKEEDHVAFNEEGEIENGDEF